MNRLLILLILFVQVVSTAAQELFIENRLKSFSDKRVSTYIESGKYKQVHYGRINNEVLGEDRISLTIPGQQSVIFSAKKKSAEEWYGEGLNRVDRMTIVKEGNSIVGSIIINNRTFEIASIDEDLTILTELDCSSFKESDRSVEKYTKPATPTMATLATTYRPLRVLVAYTTPASRSAVPSIRAHARLAINTTNQSYIDSQIHHQVELAGCVNVNYTEVGGNLELDLSRFAGKTDGYMDEIHALRDFYAADVCVLIFENAAYAGLGYLRADQSKAFCVVGRSAATNNLTFPHEIGHLQGAGHDVAVGTNHLFAYGHGYISPAKNWRTIMAYGNACGGCIRVPYFSNPNVNYPGDGRVMGSPSRENNARVINGETERLKDFRNTASVVTLSNRSLKSGEYAHVVASNQIISNGFVSLESNSSMEINAPVRVVLGAGFIAKEGSNLNIVIKNPDISSMAFENAVNEYIDRNIFSTITDDSIDLLSIQVYPSPFLEYGTIQYTVPKNGHVTIALFDLMGVKVQSLASNKYVEKGNHELPLHRKGLSSGIYYLVISIGDEVKSTKILLK